ncbi:Ig-like domain-containing alpha-2-macroglobulin family protein [Lewinella sp. JB7]|uniref:Ig-like domain-containing alpha-2-macroglobulin family protein n=1 Tax=Lewinella sp. JB7 TaxID=2962887 RepID=UPI0020C95116|nr:Ig-like domain-containing alpha-2-macroglobulin family protein [Lewinella sp. JB7]MCP9235963.1 hypothetical protein [Lewinella sp. JB7]
MRAIPALLLLALFAACRDTDGRAEVSDAPPTYILAHTSGVVSRNADLYVTFDTSYAVGEEGPSLTLTPAVAGETEVRGRQLIFRPAGPLRSNTRYTARVSLAGKPDYAFYFDVPERRLQLEADGYYIPDISAPERVEVTGRVITNDGATTDEIREAMRVEHNGRPTEFSVEQASENVFSYVVNVADRGTEPGSVVISASARGGGFAGAKQTTEVRLDPVGAFGVVGTRESPDGNGVVVRMSGPVDPNQELTGLLRFRPEVEFTTHIDGNLITLYPTASAPREAVLIVDPKLRSATGQTLASATEWQLTLGRAEPGLRAVGEGTIMPHEGRRLFTFEATGLNSVYLEIFRIDGGNVLQFLQDERLSSTSHEWSLRRVGHVVDRREITLHDLVPDAQRAGWTRYAIDLGEYLGQAGAAVYQVRLAFGLEHTDRSCSGALESLGLSTISEQLRRHDNAPGFRPLTSLVSDYNGIYDYHDWEQRDDPCSPAYYHRERFLMQNVLSSNLGLIAKRNPDRSTLIFTTNLISGSPQGGAGVTAYSYDRRELFSGTTDDEGRVRMTTEEEPAFVVGTLNQEVAYLSLSEAEALPLGRFDVGGGAAESGLRGAFFAERGVWRPGDSVYLHFVLEDRADRLPDDYPLEFILRDARGRVVERRTVTAAVSGDLYPLHFATAATDITEPWSATVRAGDRTFTRNLLIESVKPNRLSISLDPAAARNRLELSASWLYGAAGAGLRAVTDMQPEVRREGSGPFADYAFHDPARPLGEAPETQLFDGKLDARGRTTINVPPLGEQLPGPLRLRLSTRVFEPGGNFSADRTTVPYDPYEVYAGVRLPENDWGGKSLPISGTGGVEFAAVGTDGRGRANRKLTVGIYRVDWRYWWQDGNDNVARFGSNLHTEAVASYTAVTDANGRATVPIGVDDYGRYLMRVCDPGGHCAGDYFYGGDGTAGTDDRESASLLRMRTDHETVNVGERVTIKVPSSGGGQLLVSLENSLGSLEQFWMPTTPGQTEVSFATDERMVPTVYASISYLQPYAQTTNDRPVRLYGVVPVEVLDPQTRLQPELTVGREWKPRQTVEVGVREAEGRPMTYVLSVVDEGLLGLTRFATPDLHREFFSKEALTVKTYDLYDHVMSSINGEFGRVLAVGGDGTEVHPEEASANRFEPVVRHLGPFRLAGGSARHRIELPNYIGAVRVMVVAVGERAYGSTEQRVTVRQPLMVLPTLPRVLAPEERVDMPVNVFAMADRITEVGVSVSEAEGLVTIPRSQTSVTFSGAGDRLTYIPVQVGRNSGVARFEVTARGSGESANQQVEVAIREPNVPVTRSATVGIPAGESRTVNYDLFGAPATRRATLELSALPAMNLDRHLDDLLSYPYGCAEQTISTAFAQLMLDRITELSPAREESRRRNVAAAIESLRRFSLSSGGFGFWPGDQQVHPWVTSYALHFMLEAERAGFSVPYELKQSVINFQEVAASRWTANADAFYATSRQRTLDQAYRLFTLALAQRPAVGAMNRLRGSRGGELTTTPRYQLAAAYALAGRRQTARDLISGMDSEVSTYRETGYTFGSEIRDMAIVLEALVATEDQRGADEQLLRLARTIGERQQLNTQEAGFAFLALARAGSVGSQEVRAEFTPPNGASTTVGVRSGIYVIDLPTTAARSYTVSNTGSSTLYLTTHVMATPRAGEETAVSNGLRLTVTYTDLQGKPMDVTTLTSGTDFLATYRVTNPGATGQDYRQLALATLLPGGWELSSIRPEGADNVNASFDYRDIRDDRVHTFFDLPVRTTKTFTFRMTAAYPGRYYLPVQVSEAMYDPSIRSEVKGRWVEVAREP